MKDQDTGAVMATPEVFSAPLTLTVKTVSISKEELGVNVAVYEELL